jgi:5-methylcytosine-specific restriction endonuclease McrA
MLCYGTRHVVAVTAMKVTLERPVLVLNRLWQAVNVCSVERALTLLFTGHAQVVNQIGPDFQTFSFREWCDFSDRGADVETVQSIRIRLRIPRVILLLFFDRMPNKEVKFTRQNVFERDQNTCQYCHKKFDRKDLNIDHVVPRQHGGLTSWTNVVCSCIECNRIKANRTPEQAGMHLRRKPKKPRWRPFLDLRFTKTVDHSWRHFLDLAYWNVELGEDT